MYAGMQEVTITQPISGNICSRSITCWPISPRRAVGLIFIALQRRQAAIIQGINAELETANEFLATLSMKISRYLSPQIYQEHFQRSEGCDHPHRAQEAHDLFLRHPGFHGDHRTAATGRDHRNYSMNISPKCPRSRSAMAARIDKFVGDAMLMFFGDPETKGDAEDAKACLRMAIEMQDRIAGLNAKWRNAGIERPFRVRMGINTGYCNVGNFGSDDRMDYTIIGAEANLAARLQAVARARPHRGQLRNLRAGSRHRRSPMRCRRSP